MKPLHAPWPIALVTFIAGFAVMGIEILASRLIAPVFGMSVLIWTNLIGSILAALAVGAWMGGYLADKRPDRRLLGILLLGAGILTSFLTFTTPIAIILNAGLPEMFSLPLVSLILLIPPALLLGAIPPASIRLALQEIGDAGHVAGQLSAIGTLGSLVGTYITGYVLLAYWPTNRILNAIALVLVIFGLFFIRPKKNLRSMVAIAFLLLLPSFCAFIQTLPGELIPSAYSAMRMTEMPFEGKASRILWMDNSAHAGASVDQPSVSVFAYDRIAVGLAETLRADAATLLAIGGGGFHAPREWLGGNIGRKATVIERDPAAIKASQMYFDLKDDARLRIIEGDGRASLRPLQQTFDVVFIDAYADHLTIPWHLITEEAWQGLNEKLTPHSLVLVNVIVSDDPNNLASQKLIASIVNAAGPSFTWSKLLATLSKSRKPGLTNAILLLGKDAEPSDEDLVRGAHIENETEIRLFPIDQSAFPALHDRYAPVEFLTLQLLH